MRPEASTNVLGGRWAASPSIWLALFGPASVLVIMQDTETDFHTWWALPVSALAQHTVAGLVVLLLVTLARAFRPVIPRVLITVIWVAGGAARGLVSGYLTESLTTAEPQYGYRVLFWAVIAGIWIPLTVFTAAQLDRRSRLLSSVISLRSAIDAEYVEAKISEADRERRLATAVRAAIAPVVAEIRHSLDAALSESKQPLATISGKIESVVSSVLDIIVHEPFRSSTRADGQRRLIAPMHAALKFDRSRPFFASALIAVATSALLVPDSLRFGGPPEAVETFVAIAAGSLVMALLLVLLKRDRSQNAGEMWHLAVALGVAAVASALVFLVTCEFPLHVVDVMRLVAIPSALVASTAILTASVGLAIANVYAEPEERMLIEELTELRELALAREEATREQFTALLHGPVLGRLSACVMALNFHASGGPGTAASRAEVAAQVIAHLDLVTADLEAMTASRDQAQPATESDEASR